MINVFIPHRWNNNDYEKIKALFDRTRFQVRDYSVPSSNPFDRVDGRYHVDPQIQRKIKFAKVVVCSNRPANNFGMSIEEIRFAISIGKPVVAVSTTYSTSREILRLGIDVIPLRKDSLERWIYSHI